MEGIFQIYFWINGRKISMDLSWQALKLMESFFQIMESFFELTTIF